LRTVLSSLHIFALVVPQFSFSFRNGVSLPVGIFVCPFCFLLCISGMVLFFGIPSIFRLLMLVNLPRLFFFFLTFPRFHFLLPFGKLLLFRLRESRCVLPMRRNFLNPLSSSPPLARWFFVSLSSSDLPRLDLGVKTCLFPPGFQGAFLYALS